MKLAMMKSFVARATLPRLLSLSLSLFLCAKVAVGFIKACVSVCVCVAVAVCLSCYVCLSVCVCVSSLRPLLWLLFLTQRSGFSLLLPIRLGALWAVGAVGVAGRQRFVAYFNFVVCSRKRKLLHCILWSSLSGRSLYLFLLPPLSLSLSHFPPLSPSPLCFVSVANL